MKINWLIVIIIVILLAGSGFFAFGFFQPKRATLATFQQIQDGSKIKIKLGKQVIEVEVANTDTSRTQGLSDRQEIGSDGLLFVFDKPDQYRFWMKQMRFGLDFIWLADQKIVEITRDVPPPVEGQQLQFLDIYQPAVPADMMIEVAAGQAEKWGLEVDQELKLVSQ
ncbi:MAG: DUF192 domain-containing protein [Patescibacteria group bacterium]